MSGAGPARTRPGRNYVLMRAVHSNSVELVRTYMQKGYNVEAGKHAPDTPLWFAVMRGHFEMARLLVQYGAEIGTLLFTAVSVTGDRLHALDMVRLLVDNNASLTDVNANGQTPLAMAVEGGELQTIEFLIARGADTSHVDTQGDTMAHRAISCDESWCVDVLRLVLNPNKSEDNCMNRLGQTLLHVAVYENNESVVEFLLRRGVSGIVQDPSGRTPLLLAVYTRSMNQNSNCSNRIIFMLV